MKKLITLCAAFVLATSLVGCGQKGPLKRPDQESVEPAVYTPR